MIAREIQQPLFEFLKRDRYWRRYWIERIRQASLVYSPSDFNLEHLNELGKEDLLYEEVALEASNISFSKRDFSAIDLGIRNLKYPEIEPLGYNLMNSMPLNIHEDHLMKHLDPPRSNAYIEIELESPDYNLEPTFRYHFTHKYNSNKVVRETVKHKVIPVLSKRDEDKSHHFISKNDRAASIPQKDISHKYNNPTTKNLKPQKAKYIGKKYKVIDKAKSHQKEDNILSEIKASVLPKSKGVTFSKASVTKMEIIKAPEVKSIPFPKSSGISIDKVIFSKVKIYGLKDLILAIYEDDLEKIEEVLDGRKYLLDEYIAQSGKLEKEYKDRNLLGKNDQFFTWEKIECPKKKTQKTREKEWNIFNIDENSSCAVQLKFAKILSSGKKKLQSAKYIANYQEDSDLSKENYEVISLRYMKPLHLAALLGNKAAIYALMKEGADITEIDSYGFTPIHYGIIEGNNSVVAMISASSDLGKESEPNSLYKEKISPLELAAYLGKIEIFNCLILNQNETVAFDFLDKAIHSGSAKMVKTILENKEFIKRYSKTHSRKILGYTIKMGDSDLLSDILKLYNFKMDIFESKDLGNVLLESAKSPQIFEIVKLLQSRFGDGVISALLRASDSHGDTPMHIIASKNPGIFSHFNDVFGSLGMCNIKMPKTWWQKLLFRSAKQKLSEIVNDDGNTAKELFDANHRLANSVCQYEQEIINETFVLGRSDTFAETSF